MLITMITSYRAWLLVFVALLGITSKVWAEVKPHALFADNAVLQQQMDVPIWGTANDGENVTVAYQDQKVSTIAENGQWKVVLKPMTAGSGPSTMTITGAATAKPLELKNVIVGEVW